MGHGPRAPGHYSCLFRRSGAVLASHLVAKGAKIDARRPVSGGVWRTGSRAPGRFRAGNLLGVSNSSRPGVIRAAPRASGSPGTTLAPRWGTTVPVLAERQLRWG